MQHGRKVLGVCAVSGYRYILELLRYYPHGHRGRADSIARPLSILHRKTVSTASQRGFWRFLDNLNLEAIFNVMVAVKKVAKTNAELARQLGMHVSSVTSMAKRTEWRFAAPYDLE